MRRFLFLIISVFSSLSMPFVYAEDLNEKVVFEDKSAITEIHFGNSKSENKIEIYISPSCLHCGKFVVEDVEYFVKVHGDEANVILKFLPTSAKDIFIMKLIQHEAQDEFSYFGIYKNYIKRTLATINYVKPTKEQKKLFKGSQSDPEMIKFQTVASEFGFSDKKITEAYPDPKMTSPFERTVMLAYSKRVKAISKLLDSKELDLPLVVKDGKAFKSLKGILKN